MNHRLVIPVLAALWVVAVPATLIGIIILGPYTHANLNREYQDTYVRTQQTVMDGPTAYAGPGLDRTFALSREPVARGGQLLVVRGCATCHGLVGEGGPVGVPLTGITAVKMRTVTSSGPHGMPRFDPNSLSDDDLTAIAAYLDAKGGT
jgi:mono/diheme cytochrome c family protein